MGVDISDIVLRHERNLNYFKGKRLALDAFNMLYQFLASIRQYDGTPLKDFKGRITSHLSGLFYRTLNLLKNGIKPVYVFDGEHPKFKRREIEERKERKEEAMFMYEKAKDLELKELKTYAQATSKLTADMVEESKELLKSMGVPVVQAPSEGEAQAACMASKGVVYAAGSQDFDSLLFGSPVLVRNLSITGRRKLPRKDEYVVIYPEEVFLDENLKHMGIDRERLIMIGMLVGTDFNEGVKGIGPKKALQKVKSFSYAMFKQFIEQKDPSFKEMEVDDVFNFFMNPPCRDVQLKEEKMDEDKIFRLLVDEHDFSNERVKKAVNELKEIREKSKQKSLSEWFK